MLIKKLKKALKNRARNFYYLARPFYRRIKGLYWTKRLRGKGVYCPCCQNEFSGFLDYKEDRPYFYPPEKGINVLCPCCNSVNRHRILCDYFSKNDLFANLNKEEIVLFAPELSIMYWLKKHNILFTTADLFEDDVDLKLDLMDIGLEDSSIHLCICNHVLEHVPDYNKCLSELYRVLDTGGLCFLSVPILESYSTTYEDASINTKGEREKHFGQEDHLRIFGADFIEILRNAGFSVDVIDGRNTEESLRANFNGPAIYDSTKVFLCRK